MGNKLFKKRFVFIRLHAICFASLLLFTGCGGPRGDIFPTLEKPLVWPEPPEKPRIVYVGTISTEDDLKKEISWIQGLGEFIFGKEDVGVLVGPYSITIDAEDRLFVADEAVSVVHMFDLDTRGYKQFSSLGLDEKLQTPVSLTVIDGRVYVVDSMLHKVCVFDRNGNYLFSFGGENLKRPSGIAFSEPSQKIYISDTGQHVINIYDKDGEFIDRIGSRGLKPGLFNFPTHLWIDNNGLLYVSDTLNYRIQVFSQEGKFLKMFGQQGDRPGNFAHPCGVATDSFGHIYVTDRQFENIQVFDSEGQILMALGQEGNDSGEFWLPAGIYIDSNNRIFVADSFNKRVQVFELLEDNEQ
ncbi:MAG: 6-bladed beta-propeller [Planctomycetota bacterium]|jgi:DNA-binding beta-propeller fold protein YncE